MEAVAATAEVHDVEMLLVQPDQVQNCQGIFFNFQVFVAVFPQNVFRFFLN